MICNKCGKTINDTSKFCTYCGNPVSNPQTNNNELVNNFDNVTESPIIQPSNQNSYMNYQTNNTISNEDFTLNNVESVVNNTQKNINEQERVVEPSVQSIFGNQRQINNPNNYTGEEMYKPIINNKPAMVEQTIPTDNYRKPKKINKLVYIIGGSVLGLIVLIVLILSIINSSNNSVSVLEHALGNFIGAESGTVKIKATLESKTEDTLNISASAKYNKTDTGYDMSLTLDKSILFDEINAYANIVGKKLNLFVESNTIDMLGLTSSDTNMWLYYIQDLEGAKEQVNSKIENGEIKLDSIIDKEHFKYIDKKDNLKHYQLKIDQELLNKIKENTSNSENGDTEFNNIIDTKENKNSYNIDLYIDSSNKLERASIDLTDSLKDNDYKSVVFSVEFIDFNKTKVAIPDDVLQSNYDLTSYMSKYSSLGASSNTKILEQ